LGAPLRAASLLRQPTYAITSDSQPLALAIAPLHVRKGFVRAHTAR